MGTLKGMIWPWYFLKMLLSFLMENHALCDHILIGDIVNIQRAGLGWEGVISIVTRLGTE
jgi:hypothetical protein